MSDGPMSTVRWVDMAVAQVEAADKALNAASRPSRTASWRRSWTPRRTSSSRVLTARARPSRTRTGSPSGSAAACQDRQTLKDTDGKVADNATRDNLAKAIDEANNTLSKKGVTDPKTYTDAKAKLDAAVRQVTDSKAAKEQADAEAAAQAQAQAAAQAAAQSQRSYSQSYNRYGGSGSGYSSNRGYSAPRQSYTAPQQSYTPSSNGGGSHRTFDFSNSGSNGGPNTCGSTCGLIER